MRLDGVTGKIVLRYACIQTLETLAFVLVLILAGRWIEIPGWLFITLCAVWVAKDFILFPFVWPAYDWDNKEVSNPMVGMPGIVSQRLDPKGYVEVRGERWQAELEDEGHAVETGEAVQVVGMRGLTLIVEPEKTAEDKK
jgi:membrane-bound ClpP family serine protease